MSKQQPKASPPELGITVRIIPQDGGYVGYAAKDGKILFEITDATLYLSVAGQLRRYLDLGMSL